MMKKQIDINTIPAEKLQFAQEGVKLADKKLQTKPRGYFKDAWIRFKKNKSSVVAVCIIAFLILYAIVAPLLTPYTLDDRDNRYLNRPGYVYGSEWLGNGCKQIEIGESTYFMYQLLEIETGMNIIEKVYEDKTYYSETAKANMYLVDINRYKDIGIVKMDVTLDEFYKMQAFQDAHNIQMILPATQNQPEASDYAGTSIHNYWYKVSARLQPLNADGEVIKDVVNNVDQLVPMYVPYDSMKANDFYVSNMRLEKNGEKLYEYYRLSGSSMPAVDSTTGTPYLDDFGNPMVNSEGNAVNRATQVSIRVNYFYYYAYMNGEDGNAMYPAYVFGTNGFGQDIFGAMGKGARFSLILSVCVSVINFIIGLIYGSIQGFYGGTVDMVLDRISDVLSGVPFIVVATLFSLHLSSAVGPVISLLFAFVSTGWIGTAALVRKQFYRFKGQEYVTVAKSLGASDTRIMFKHIFPNSLGTIVTSCALVIPSVISTETMLTYLGIVDLAQSGMTTLGVLLSYAQGAMTEAPHVLFLPSLYLALLLISFNLFGNGLRDAFNPSLRGSED